MLFALRIAVDDYRQPRIRAMLADLLLAATVALFSLSCLIAKPSVRSRFLACLLPFVDHLRHARLKRIDLSAKVSVLSENIL
jgi:hypothetical protein